MFGKKEIDLGVNIVLWCNYFTYILGVILKILSSFINILLTFQHEKKCTIF